DIDKLMSIENKPEVLKSYLFSTLTGLRFSDSKELKYSDLTHNRLKKVQRKTNKPLDNPLSTKVWDLVDKDKVSQDKLVFELGYNSSMNYELKKLVESVDIKKHITFRTSRNTFAQRLSNIEPNLKTVSSLMGHQYINTTLGYVHATDAEKSNAINKL
ncbi:MAG: tyrosine-type recombinase/integrase, partial [Candidatus Kapaibacterium sp.]